MEKIASWFGRHKRAQQEDHDLAVSSSASEPEKGQDGLVDTHIPRLTWRSLTMGILVSMGGFLFGYDTGMISGILAMKDFLRQFGSPGPGPNGSDYHFTNVRSGLIVALLSVGTLMGALIAAPIADRIGRKWSISGWCIVLAVGIIVQISSMAPRWWQIMMGRWVAGLGVGALSLLVPLYMGESGPRHVRGALVSTYQLFITLGILVANCINFGTETRNDESSWRIPIGITFIWLAILGFGMALFPESPRYDYRRGKTERAKRTMTKLYGVPENHRQLHLEFEEIRAKHEEDMATQGQPWYEMFHSPMMTYRIVLGIVLQALQQLTGANYFFYYGTVIFQGAGIKNSYVTQMILGGVNFGCTFLGLYNIEHFGRRKSLIVGAGWMFICFMVFASVGHFSLDYRNPPATPGPGKVMVVFACLFILGFASTWGPMVWAIVSEIYPSRYRARCMAFATASNWFWNFLLAFFTPFIADDIDFRYGYVFAGCLFLALATVYFGVIEGKDRTLEELDAMYIMGVKPWKSSKFVFPEGAAERIVSEVHYGAVSVPDRSDPTAEPFAGNYELPESSMESVH